MKKIIDGLVKELINHNIICEEDKVIYSYGFNLLVFSSVAYMSILFFSYILGNMLETIIYVLAFITLRVFAGGYHAKTFSQCYMVSIISYIFFSLGIHIIYYKHIYALSIVVAIFSFFIVYKYAPVVHINHSSAKNMRQLKTISLVICFIELLAIIFLKNHVAHYILYAIASGLLFESFSILMVKLSNNKKLYLLEVGDNEKKYN